MGNYTRHMTQTVTYWAPLTEDLFGGATFSAPVALKGRWEDKAAIVRDRKGVEVLSKSRIFLVQEVALEGFVLLGTSTAADPRTVTGAMEIIQRSMTPDLRNLTQLYVVYV